MKTLSQHLKQAFNALEFTNAGNLTTLTTMLDTSGRSVSADCAEQQNASAERDVSTIAAPNSPCF